ncbi:MAG: hypothetical protein LBF15_00120 [Candidatus Peribacteria bacterium]|nr:hypothetical protein [Candidatus Peribacteria bacterium]
MAQSRAKKRFIISAFLGLVAGLVCVWLASTGSNPNIWGLKSWVMWAIITNRLLLGVVIGFA